MTLQNKIQKIWVYMFMQVHIKINIQFSKKACFIFFLLHIFPTDQQANFIMTQNGSLQQIQILYLNFCSGKTFFLKSSVPTWKSTLSKSKSQKMFSMSGNAEQNCFHFQIWISKAIKTELYSDKNPDPELSFGSIQRWTCCCLDYCSRAIATFSWFH